jgi:glycosyltransferase involved in cell wall biosynthesis
MAENPLRVALDLSCALDTPRTGVGNVALYQTQALGDLDTPLDLRLFATRSFHAARGLPELEGCFTQERIIPYAGHLKRMAWVHLNAPPLEWFVGPCDIAHGLFHLLPAARGAKRVVTIHDLSFLRFPEMHTLETTELHGAMVRHAAREADGIIAVSESTRSEIVELLDVDPARVHVVHNGFDTVELEGPLDEARWSALTKRMGIGSEYIIHLGTLEPRKNIVRLLQAYAQLRKRLDSCPPLLLVGKKGWLYDSIFDSIEELALADCVVHAGHLQRDDALTLLRGARLCVYPSLYEGFGLPVLEAMAAGAPVVTSNRSALAEVAGDAARLADPYNVDSIEEAMAAVLTDSALRESMVAAGADRAREWTWEGSARKLLEVYRSILEGGRVSS